MADGDNGPSPAGRVPPDEELARRARSGDRDAFAAIVERYQRQVYLFCLRYVGDPSDAVELANETFYRAWRGLAHYDPTRPWRPWLLRIAVNLCRRHYHTLMVRRTREQPTDRFHPSPAELRDTPEPPELATIRQAERARVREALASLPDGQRQAAILYYGVGLDYREIGETLGVPLGTVSTWLNRARERLRRALQEGGSVDATATFGRTGSGAARFGRTR